MLRALITMSFALAAATSAVAQTYSITEGRIAVSAQTSESPSYSVRGGIAVLPTAESAAGSLSITGANPLGQDPCPGDLTGDGAVDSSDLAGLLAQWGQAGGADLDGSGVVDAGDLAALV